VNLAHATYQNAGADLLSTSAVFGFNVFMKSLRKFVRASALACFVLLQAGFSVHAESLPGAYNLIQPDPSNPEIIDVTGVRDQGNLGSCWANAATTAFESSILKNELVERLDDPRLDLSTWHMAVHASHSAPSLKASYDPVQDDHDYSNWGGNANDAIAYWTRGYGSWRVPGAPRNYTVGGGPVTTTSHPLNAYPVREAADHEDLQPCVPPANEHPAWRLEQSHRMFFDHSGPPTKKERDAVKWEIMNTSAVISEMHGEFSKYFNATTGTYVFRGADETATHDVVLIGWDDAIYVPRAKHRGAWLVQNSYGEDSEDAIHTGYRGLPESDLKGCFWLSYDDTAALKDNYAVVAASLGNFSDRVLQNQIFKDDSSEGNLKGEPDKALSVLNDLPPIRLAAVGIMTQVEGDSVHVRVYDTLRNGETDDGKTGLLGSARAVLNNFGYATIHFKDPITIKSPRFYVIVDFGVTDKAAIGVDTRSPRKKGLSYVYYDSKWVDLNEKGEESGTFFLKGIVLQQGNPAIGH
jgi:hypothetical protein